MDGIDLRRKVSSEDKHYFSNSKPKVEDNERLNANAENELVFINKLSHNPDDKEQLCKAYVEIKHTKIVKSKNITPIIKKLQEVYVNLWGHYRNGLAKQY